VAEIEDIGFVHLHVHSSFSLLEGALKIADLSKLAAKDQQPALALTDTNTLFGALEFSEKLSGAGIQPIIGVQLDVLWEDERGKDEKARLVLLAQDEEGYGNLMHLVSQAHCEAPLAGVPCLTERALAARCTGLIALTGGFEGPIDRLLRAGRGQEAQKRLERLEQLFPNRLYVEIQRQNEEAGRIEAALIALADAAQIPLVATNEPFFAAREDFEAHDALLAIAEGRLLSEDNRRRVSEEHRFTTRAEMRQRFADLPDALASSVEIAQRCAFKVPKRPPILPRFGTDENEELKILAHQGLDQRLKAHGPAPGLAEQDYHDRLDFELSVIIRMHYAGYFLIVADFIRWAKAHDIPVGPGRGSGAGSLVAYALTITDLDPLRFSLLFERFLNPERVSMPDFDIDFCQDGRERVIDYVRNRYGADKVAQIITFGTLQARGVMRDVGRVLEMPYGQVDKLTKLVPANPANPVTLRQAIEGEPKLQEAAREEPIVGRMLAIAEKLEGLHRHASTHAAGLVIGDRPLQELVPLYRDPKSGMLVTQFNMKWVEQAGLVKFDFLGLKTLTVLRSCIDLLKKQGIIVTLSSLPLNDAKTYEMLGRGETVGVFQVESAGMRKALADMKADRFEDIIALVALYRPGPMANIPVYNARKNGLGETEKDWYPDPALAPILKETFGIIVYQEQVMQAAQLLAGYSLGDADLLRRAMGKKIKAEMDAQRGRFVSGAVERGMKRGKADEIFDLLAKFADYGFNKSHAAAYALISYQTAWFKAHHPVEFLAASMTLDLDNTDKLAEFRREAQRLGILVEPPDINRCGAVFEVHDGAIRYALAAISGVGLGAVEAIVQARGDRPFRDLTDFARRLPLKALNRRTLEALAAAGAFDTLEKDRARVFAAIDPILALASQAAEAEKTGIVDMFGGVASESVALRIPSCDPWTADERLKREYEAIGFFLSGHPLEDYAPVIRRMRLLSWMEFVRAVKSGAATSTRLAASVLERTERRTKSGSKMGIVSLSDKSGHFEAIVFSETLQALREHLEPGKALLLTLQATLEGEDVRVRIAGAEPLDAVLARQGKALRISLTEEGALPSLRKHLTPHSGTQNAAGTGEVSLLLRRETQEIEIRLPGRYPITPQISGILRNVRGVEAVEVL
jgi:DNA polymerase III subunit alpha